jgi:hypothetical protein
MNTITSRDITQCATDCSRYCSDFDCSRWRRAAGGKCGPKGRCAAGRRLSTYHSPQGTACYALQYPADLTAVKWVQPDPRQQTPRLTSGGENPLPGQRSASNPKIARTGCENNGSHHHNSSFTIVQMVVEVRLAGRSREKSGGRTAEGGQRCPDESAVEQQLQRPPPARNQLLPIGTADNITLCFAGPRCAARSVDGWRTVPSSRGVS